MEFMVLPTQEWRLRAVAFSVLAYVGRDFASVLASMNREDYRTERERSEVPNYV
jgi:hypothetical protein